MNFIAYDTDKDKTFLLLQWMGNGFPHCGILRYQQGYDDRLYSQSMQLSVFISILLNAIQLILRVRFSRMSRRLISVPLSFSHWRMSRTLAANWLIFLDSYNSVFSKGLWCNLLWVMSIFNVVAALTFAISLAASQSGKFCTIYICFIHLNFYFPTNQWYTVKQA